MLSSKITLNYNPDIVPIQRNSLKSYVNVYNFHWETKCDFEQRIVTWENRRKFWRFVMPQNEVILLLYQCSVRTCYKVEYVWTIASLIEENLDMKRNRPE